LWFSSYILEQIVSLPNVNFAQDWKAMNMLIGANDVCLLCEQDTLPTVEQAADAYEESIRKVVEKVYEEIPRVFLNFIPMFNISGVYNLSLGLTYCKDFHDVSLHFLFFLS
jgi:hypothetical protein